MVDALGKPIQLGDPIAHFTAGSGSSVNFRQGHVEEVEVECTNVYETYTALRIRYNDSGRISSPVKPKNTIVLRP